MIPQPNSTNTGEKKAILKDSVQKMMPKPPVSMPLGARSTMPVKPLMPSKPMMPPKPPTGVMPPKPVAPGLMQPKPGSMNPLKRSLKRRMRPRENFMDRKFA